MSSRLQNNSGMTLLEVLIAIVLLMIISAYTSRKVIDSQRLSVVLRDEGDFYNGVRLAMGVIDRDIALIYSPTLANPGRVNSKVTDTNEIELLRSTELGRDTKYWNSSVDKSGIRASHFLGTDNSLQFIAASNIRVYKEARESELVKVTYELQDDKTAGAEPGSKVLVKTTNVDVFNDDDRVDSSQEAKLVRAYPLLRGVKKLEFKYYNRAKENWESKWDNQSQDFRDRYPDLVQVTVTVHGGARLHFEGGFIFTREVPYEMVPATL